MLNTFGAVLTFAIALEAALQHFYEQANTTPDDLFDAYAKRSAKRGTQIVAVRQDNVTEMILEPIDGLSAESYAIDHHGHNALQLEEIAERFYNDAAPKLNVTEARRVFQKLAAENAARLVELRARHA